MPHHHGHHGHHSFHGHGFHRGFYPSQFGHWHRPGFFFGPIFPFGLLLFVILLPFTLPFLLLWWGVSFIGRRLLWPRF